VDAGGTLLGGALPKLWSAEEPNLYVLVLELRTAAQQLIEVEACQVRVGSAAVVGSGTTCPAADQGGGLPGEVLPLWSVLGRRAPAQPSLR
jgi:hypothetical protein